MSIIGEFVSKIFLFIRILAYCRIQFKGTYDVNNFSADAERLPAYMPAAKFKISVNMVLPNETISQFKLHGAIENRNGIKRLKHLGTKQ